MGSFVKFFIFFLVFIFTFILRAHNYERVPTPNHLDEQLYALSGINLIETGVPVSWSTLDYPESAEVFSGKISYKGGDPSAYVTLYKPWLDEPPLFSLIVGEAAHLFGADRTGFIPSSYIRFPVIFISALTSVFVFLIGRKVGGFRLGILAMLIYGTEPIMVFGSRSAMPENLIAFLFSATIFLLLKYREKKKFVYIFAIPIFSGIAGLAKPTGYFILPLALFVVFAEIYNEKVRSWSKIFKTIGYLIIATLPFLGAYLWYGNHFDPEIFKRILSIQGYRPAGFNSLAWFFITPSYDISILRSSWYVFCLISAVLFIFTKKEKPAKLLSLSFLYWLAVIMLSSGENDLLSWYRFPVFPLLAIFGAWGIGYLYKRADFFASFIVSGFLLGGRMLLVNAFRPNVTTGEYRAIFPALLAPSIANMIFNKIWLKKLTRVVIGLVVVVGMWWNIKYVYNAYEIACENQTCPMVPTTTLSRIHFPVIWRLFVLGEPVLR